LLKQGWEEAPTQNWITVFHRIADVSSSEHLPLVAPLYLDKQPALILVKHNPDDKRLIVLRLWSSNINIPSSTEPLWVGSVGTAPRTYSWLINYKSNKSPLISTSMIFNQVPNDYVVKEISVSIHVKRKHRWQPQPMLLIRPKNIT
jgi:hypothetical protein